MKISVIGAGYVGLVTAACFADLGHEVINVDNDSRKLALLKKGKCHFFEPGLQELILKGMSEGRLSFESDAGRAAAKTDVVFIAVGTPPKDDGGADLSQIEEVAKQVAKNIRKKFKLIIEKSTVPVRTGIRIRQIIRKHAPKGARFGVASNPEFLREGTAIHDFMNPDRIIVGADSATARKVLKDLYENINGPLMITDLQSSEIIKHASNSFLAMKISFINAISRVCELSGANVEEVAEGMGLDTRIGPKFLNAGIGFGGFCFPKDLAAFIKISEELGYDFSILKAVERVNHEQIGHYLTKLRSKIKNLKGKTVGILGLAFKPNTDDMRFAPSIEIINQLISDGAKIRAFDPEAMGKAKEIFPKITYCKDAYDAAKNADCLLVLTEWNEFKEMDMLRLKRVLKKPLVIDGRNIYKPKQMQKLGIEYVSMGRE